MKTIPLTCVECPVGCRMEVDVEDGKVIAVSGNSCPRGKMFAENEVLCPRRVLTTTVKSRDGKIIPVKTDKPIKKEEIFNVMQKINGIVCDSPIKIGDVLYYKVTEDINLIATGNAKIEDYERRFW